jgi:hypothetical protein
MWGVQGMLEVLTRSGIEEGLRFAYAASQLMPAGIVVGGAAVLAGLLGAAGLRKMRVAKPPATSHAGVPWVLGAALLASGVAADPADATVLCRKGQSARLVLRADTCRAREHVAEPSELGIDRGATCVESIELAWEETDILRAQLEGARDLAMRLAVQPWDGAETWLKLEAVRIAQTLARLDDVAETLGVAAAADPIARVRAMVTEEWARPADACAAALDLLPLLEAALPTPGAG